MKSLFIFIFIIAVDNSIAFTNRFQLKYSSRLCFQIDSAISVELKSRIANSRFQEEFEDYNDHLPQFLKVGLAPRTAPDYPHKLRKQYKAMFGGAEISPPKRQQSLNSNIFEDPNFNLQYGCCPILQVC